MATKTSEQLAPRKTKAMNSTKADVDVRSSELLKGWVFFLDADGTIVQAIEAKTIVAVARDAADTKRSTVQLADSSWYASSVAVASILGAMSQALELAQRRRRQAA